MPPVNLSALLQALKAQQPPLSGPAMGAPAPLNDGMLGGHWHPVQPPMSLGDVGGLVGGTLADAVQGVTGWRPGTTPSWMPQSLVAASDANKAAADANAQALGKYGFTPQDQAIAMGFTGPDVIEAYHASPHNFDQFDMSKIGTGEGAQAYGHGLYNAEALPVANDYYLGFLAKKLGKTLSPQEERMGSALAQGKSPLDIIRQEASYGSGDFDQISSKLDQITANKPTMYQTRINAAPEQFLDWDKPLSQQSPQVQGVLQSLGIDTKSEPKWTVEPSKSEGKWVVRNVWGEHAGTFKTKEAAQAKADAGTASHNQGAGALAYQKLGGNHVYSSLDTGEASQRLSEAGIPGIRYLDQGSRGAGAGTHNYVVFNDKLIDILKKYGLAGLGLLGAGGIGAAAMPGQAQASQPELGR